MILVFMREEAGGGIIEKRLRSHKEEKGLVVKHLLGGFAGSEEMVIGGEKVRLEDINNLQFLPDNTKPSSSASAAVKTWRGIDYRAAKRRFEDRYEALLRAIHLVKGSERTALLAGLCDMLLEGENILKEALADMEG